MKPRGGQSSRSPASTVLYPHPATPARVEALIDASLDAALLQALISSSMAA